MALRRWLKNTIHSSSNANYTAGVYWANVYNSTILDSKWLINKAVSPGRWAVGYEFLYVLYRTMNDVRPTSILELGLGQSTKITSQYAQHAQCTHVVCEQDTDWIDFFSKSYQIPKNTQILYLPLNENDKSQGNYTYDGFQEKFVNHKFDLISVDGPWGGDNDRSRTDILSLLPGVLKNDFAILFDDTERIGERHTVEDARQILDESNITCFVGEYEGEKTVSIITSANWRFLCSL